jgi:hypothetical protein
LAISGVFTPVLAKHSKSFSLIDCISVGVDRMQRNFEPMRKQVETWQRSELTDVTAKVVIYEAFVEGKLEAPKDLARAVHDLYFEPKYEDSGGEPSGVSPTRSLPHPRNWIPSRNSRLPPNWANSWKPGSHNRSSLPGGFGESPLFQHWRLAVTVKCQQSRFGDIGSGRRAIALTTLLGRGVGEGSA